MITFIPERPSSLTPDCWQSEIGNKALDKGFEWYCETFFDYLGNGFYKVHEASNAAERAGLYMASIQMASKLADMERNQ